ncbi:hypothetical protein OF385_01945 [Glutamicibacter sp. JL.03c]|uniref:hypothetical protein n=1 Tax=Glutamicibacter sp. JL.03c TaxID=2984842 RepID=UPI0021F6DA0A|nr:hypothetical protein [Glutamicibacter sp. JL.03c]UYQ77959.1 hypothetical protein OF385_01945 [Glutamicibacter sp. JL.03c]
MNEAVVESEGILELQDNKMSRKQLAWGILLLAVAAIFGLGAGWLWALLEQLWPAGRVVFFIVAGESLVFCGFLISGLAAAAGLLCLVPKMITRIGRKTTRVLVRIIVHLFITAASLAWLGFWLISGLNALMSDYHKVNAETGESVVVSKPGFDPASFVVYTPKSPFVYQEVYGISSEAESGHFVSGHCTLEKQNTELVLTCGEDVTKFPAPES